MAYSPVLGEDVGIEIEVTGVTEQAARYIIERSNGVLRGWAVHHDGSTQKGGYGIPGMMWSVRNYHERSNPPMLFRRIQTGAEFVSPILDTSDTKWLTQLGYLCDQLRLTTYEVPGTYTSVHVHVSAAGLPLLALKNLLRVWRFIEAPMFRLSVGDLGFHRGTVRKDYAYCRPMDHPLVVFDQNGVLRPSFDVNRLLTADSMSSFFLGYGATSPQSEPIRWHPARYTALNLLPLLTIGTVEFRIFNQTTDERSIVTWVDLCKAIVSIALTSKGLADDEYPHLPLGYSGEFDLGMMQTLLELPDKTMYGVQRLWGLADWCKFDPFELFNSNNENSALSWNNLSAPTVPPAIDGQPVMMYAPVGSGRNSEELVYVFHDRNSYRSATNKNPLPVQEGRALVHAGNFPQEPEGEAENREPREVESEERREPQPIRQSRNWSPTTAATTYSSSGTLTSADWEMLQERANRATLNLDRFAQAPWGAFEPIPPIPDDEPDDDDRGFEVSDHDVDHDPADGDGEIDEETLDRIRDEEEGNQNV